MRKLNVRDELPIGAVGTVLNGAIVIEVVEHKISDSSCKMCAIKKIFCADALCFDIQRKDKKNIYFKSINK